MDGQIIWGLLLLSAISLATFAYLINGLRERRYKAPVVAQLPDRHTRLVETVSFTTAGIFAWVLVGIANLVNFAIVMNEKTLGGQIIAGLVWLAANQVLVMGVSLGRRSTYVLYRGTEDKET